MTTLNLQVGQAREPVFTIKDKDGNVIPPSEVTLTFVVTPANGVANVLGNKFAVTAVGNGTATILWTATSPLDGSSASDTTTVNVGPANLATLEVTFPAPA